MRGTEISEFIDSAYTWQERAINAEAEVERLKEYLNKIYERVRPEGINGGYPYGATNFLGYEVFKIVDDWRREQANKEVE
jgi:hypothetical protein